MERVSDIVGIEMVRGISRHEEVLDYLKFFNLTKMRMPTVKEITFDLKIGKGVLYRVLDGLVKDEKLIRMLTWFEFV